MVLVNPILQTFLDGFANVKQKEAYFIYDPAAAINSSRMSQWSKAET